MKNKILVTGATGFLGGHLVAKLESQGRIVISHSSVKGDIATCLLPMEGVSHVFHLAGKSYVPDSWQNPLSFYDTNVTGTVNVLEHCRRNQAALTLISSYVYGQPQRFADFRTPSSGGRQSLCSYQDLAESAARFYEQRFGVALVIVRPFNIYGPGQRQSFLIPSILRQVLDPAAGVVRLKDLRPRRDYLYVDDAVAFLLATLRPGTRGVYNMGSGRSASVAEVAQLIGDAAGIRKPVVSDEEPRPGEILDMFADTSRAAADLAWQPHTSLADGLAAVVVAERAVHG